MPPGLPGPNAFQTGLTITNPLVLYRTLLSTKSIDPDPAQHRLALALQKLYAKAPISVPIIIRQGEGSHSSSFNLKDYSPKTPYGAQLSAITRAAENGTNTKAESPIAVPGHPLRRNPLFSHLFKSDRDTLALTRVLTSYEGAMLVDSPKGLLLHGEVGTGKSMLVDLLADCLPNRKKRRWHFNTFMLEILARLEQLRQSRSVGRLNDGDSEHSLIWLAKDMIEDSPILFLDEFQLPDRAASKILSNLFTIFFQLGGVLIATSNRLPDELAKASGMDFSVPPRGGLVHNWLRFGKKKQYPANNEYSDFVTVLKARCQIWDMEGEKDWRRREADEITGGAAKTIAPSGVEMAGSPPDLTDITVETARGHESNSSTGPEINNLPLEGLNRVKGVTPKNYIIEASGVETDELWNDLLRAALPSEISQPIPWQSTTLLVYGRKVHVQSHLADVAYWTFHDLCGGTLGAADYITLASTFHTLILDHVPVLSLSQKNEARRMITLLDALYEARCKLVIRAEAGPDDLFFPESSPIINKHIKSGQPENAGGDAVYPETLSEIYQDQTSPFRPNVSAYNHKSNSGYNQDEDSDLGPTLGSEQVDFGSITSFTGDDERFAYKRARSRLWEMCGARWHSKSVWTPLPPHVRRWERSSSSNPLAPKPPDLIMGDDVQLGESIELDRPAGLQGIGKEEGKKTS